ncbi:hypothetical protein M9H77_11138 [Catharanthus roseus]|uniref:Uncharacterized protein n=1 Tax=Catharanthus roseus TaxID=4058 RepID=A0ACC0BDN6_CATRO|nr:hypothetical protein M9H77_11138 [Catharanthus roseus]
MWSKDETEVMIKDSVIKQRFSRMMATNYMGAFCLTKALLPLLENSPVPSRVVNVSSFTHRNVCLILFSYELNRQIVLMQKSHRVSVVVADPGAVKTNIMREIPSHISQIALLSLRILGILQSPDIGVRSILDAALAPPEITGVYFFGGNGTTIKSSALSYDTKLSKDLWNASIEMFRDLQLSSSTNASM